MVLMAEENLRGVRRGIGRVDEGGVKGEGRGEGVREGGGEGRGGRGEGREEWGEHTQLLDWKRRGRAGWRCCLLP